MATEEGTKSTEKVRSLMRVLMMNAEEKREEWITRGA